MKAIWNGKVIAESDNTVVVENNHYFPVDSVNKDFLVESELQTVCPWKGTANYHHLKVDGKVNQDAMWHYKTPSVAAQKIKDHVAFWRGVEIVD
ncbi:MAG: DUF427 domain-containing protein [Bacteroidia bacterium]|nr:DUF427 domain-containing protein [Bacteroidia bacterium]